MAATAPPPARYALVKGPQADPDAMKRRNREIVELLRGGHTAGEVAEAYRLSTARVHAISAKAAGSTKPKRGDQATRYQAVQAYLNGVPQKIVAEAFDVSDVSVGAWIRAAGHKDARGTHLAAQRRILRCFCDDFLGRPVRWEHPEDDQGGAS